MAESEKDEVEEIELSNEIINNSNKYSDGLIDNMIEEVDLREDIEIGSVTFGLFVFGIHLLSSFGWTKEDLIKEIHNHFEEE